MKDIQNISDFPNFPKIPRLSRACTITEKIDGTNGLISISEEGIMRIGSKNRWITPEDDNYGFARWCMENKGELIMLGPGNHYGEWWGKGIQKRHSTQPRTFSLFNVHRWASTDRPSCCSVVPVLYRGVFSTEIIEGVMKTLSVTGSIADANCNNPEGIIIWHEAARQYFKKTLDKDEEYKGKQNT